MRGLDFPVNLLYFNQMNKDLIEKVQKWVEEIYSNANHLVRTGYWVKRLYPEAKDSLIIASITHDIERAFKDGRNPPSPEMNGAKWDDPVYNRWHSERSAVFVKNFLKKEGANSKLIDDVAKLISVHEEGGWKEADLLRDSDSISFLEINAPYFISKIGKDLSSHRQNLSRGEVREKFDYMFNRIGSKKAKQFATPFYEKAIEELNKVKD